MVTFRELERRWRTLRALMKEKGLEWIICEGAFRRLGGYPMWFTGRPPVYNTIIAFPVEGDLYYISHGGGHHRPQDSPGVRHLVKPFVSTLCLNSGADLVVDVLKKSKPSRVGLVGFGTLSAATYIKLTKSFPDVEFVDATDLVDEVKAVKSDEEISYINQLTEKYREAWDFVTKSVKVGVTPREILIELIRRMVAAGSSEWLTICGAAPADALEGVWSLSLDRPMKSGDVFVLMMEFNGPEGYYNELLRYICIKEVPKRLEDAFETAREAQKRMANLLLPGRDPNEILEENNRFLEDRGYPREARLAGHGQGYDLVERPAFSPAGETLKLKAGMVVSLHPSAFGVKAWGELCDNFLVSETGGIRLTKVPQEIVVVDG
jgi:Xaa-Pro aminopeptidase